MSYNRKEYTILKYSECFLKLKECCKDIQKQDISDLVNDIIFYYNNIVGMYRDNKISDKEYCYWSMASMKLIEMFLKEKLKNE